jgi:hypothetical protein
MFGHEALSDIPAIRERPNASEPPPEYLWEFGDGTELGTNVPYAEHDFAPAIDFQREYQQFDVTVTHQRPPFSTVTRTLVIYNAYFSLKTSLGALVPPVDELGDARKSNDGYLVTMKVTNPETFPITFTRRRLIPIFADNDAPADPLPVETLPTPVTVPAGSTQVIQVSAPFDQIPGDAVGFSAYYAGEAPDGTPVRIGGHFDVSPHERFSAGLGISLGSPSQPHHQAIGKMFSQAVRSIQNRPGASLTLGDVRLAGHRGDADLNNFALVRPIISNINHVLSSSRRTARRIVNPIAQRLHTELQLTPHDITGFGRPLDHQPQEGSLCDPFNPPEDVPADLVCQATSETALVVSPGRFMNARKGDIVLSPGGNGLIGGLLQQVTPAQRYSHSGIMTRNHDQITHCTMSEERMMAYPVGTDPVTGDPAPVHGFRPDAVKYGWPGAITQTVENAVTGEPFLDPETASLPSDQKKWYMLHSFGAQPEGMDLGGSWVIVPPLVVMPDPFDETPALRRQLHAIADDAAAQTGKGHYRFFCYSDPTITQTAPPESGWAAGTFPAVCSSFIWKMMKQHGVQLEGRGPITQDGDLEILDKEAGAEVGPTTPDGLYLYRATEWLNAAHWFHDALANRVYAKTGWIGELFTKAVEHITNEILNTFDTDQTQTDDDNTPWQQQRDTNAVSPDNLLFWDKPSAGIGSLYGFAQPLIYREPRYDVVTVYRWKKVVARGNLSGLVSFNNTPVGGSMVQLTDDMTTFSDGSGHYQLTNVPFGQYVVVAQKVQPDGTFLSAHPALDLDAPDTTFDIHLQPPPEQYRTVHINGNIHTRYTRWIGPVKVDDQSGDQPFYRALDVGPFNTHAETTVTHDVVDAHAVLHITVDWKVNDNSILVGFTFQLHDQTTGNNFAVPKDGWQSWWATCTADNDESKVDFTVANDLKQA